MRRKFIMITILCLCVISTLLAGCGNNVEQLQAADEEFYEEIQKIEPDELTKRANLVMDSYQGDGNDIEYMRVKAIAIAEDTRQYCLIEIASCELKIENAEKVLRFCEKVQDQDLKKKYQEMKANEEETKNDMVTLLKDTIELEEALLEDGVQKSETKSMTKSELML